MAQTREPILADSVMYGEPTQPCVSKAGTRLQPCPFCRAQSMGVVEYVSEPRTVAVRCLRCHAEGPDMRDEETAVRAWNSRV